MMFLLQAGCLILGILCFLYYGAIVLHVGLGADFAWIWILGGAFCLLLGGLARWQLYRPGHWSRFLMSALLLLAAAALLLLLAVGGRIVAGMRTVPPERLDYVVVLGAQVRGTKPSRALRKRLDRALAYAGDNPDTVFILSGGQGPDEGISEAECMYRYLTGHGMDPERLLLEDRSTSTRENLDFSAQYLDCARDRVGILSNNFHIYRALRLAERAGYRQASGIPAPSDPLMQLHYVLREICAVTAGGLLWE